MDEIELILEKITIPVIVWKRETDNSYVCQIENKMTVGVTKGTIFEEYVESLPEKNEYHEFIQTKSLKKITLVDSEIILEFINGQLFYEIHYPKYNLYLLKTISQQIRNPLTNIIGIISILEGSQHDSEIKNYIEIIKKSSIAIISVINDMIDILHYEQGLMILEKKKIEVYKFFKMCKSIVYNDAKEKKINLKFTLDEDLPKVIISDEKRLEQIVVTLVNNALNNQEYGIISVSFGVLTKDEMKQYDLKTPSSNKYNMLLKVKDSGKGYSDEERRELNRIFQGTNGGSLMNSCKFVSFGIIIVKYLITLMEGKIWFRSDKEMGSIFYCYLPLTGF